LRRDRESFETTILVQKFCGATVRKGGRAKDVPGIRKSISGERKRGRGRRGRYSKI